MSGDAPHGILFNIDCGLKLGLNPALQGEFWKKIESLEYGFVLRKFEDAFEPGINEENNGNKAEYHTCNCAGFHPKLTIPSKEK